MPTVELTPHLYQFFPAFEGRALEVPGTTVAEVMRGMEALAPGFAFYVCDERGRLRQHVNIFIGEERVTDRATLTDPVGPESRIFIIQALSGG
jgi:hypothetical protein